MKSNDSGPKPLARRADGPYDDEIANRQYLLGRLAARRLSPQRLEQFRAWLELQRRRHGDYPYYREWLALTERGPSAVAATLSDATEHRCFMRSVATMLPFVTRTERAEFYQEHVQKISER